MSKTIQDATGRKRTVRKLRPRWLSLGIPERTVRASCRCRNAYSELERTAEEVLLDVRDLPLGGQIGRTMQRSEALEAGQRLRVVGSFIPWPLFAMLETRGYRYRLLGRKQGDFHMMIWCLAGETNAVPAAAGTH